MKTTIVAAATLLLWAGAFGNGGSAHALDTGFTYQGHLQDNGTPEDGPCDFEFSLFDSKSGGTQIGSTLRKDSAGASDGRFTVRLDFGAAVFTGDDRWLQIAVRCPGGAGSFTLLSPRQQLTAAPYALHAEDAAAAPWSGLTGVPAGFADDVDQDTTYTAGSGLTLSGGEFSVDTNVIQARLAAACLSGSSIRAVAADGGVTCEADDDSGGDITGVTAGTGLSGGGQGGSVTLVVNFAGSGAAATVARSDHNHFGGSWSGGGPGLQVDSSDNVGLLGRGAVGVRGEAVTTGTGVLGVGGTPTGSNLPGPVGVWGDSAGGIGLIGTSTSNIGVLGESADPLAAVLGQNVGGGAGVRGTSGAGPGVAGLSAIGFGGSFSGPDGSLTDAVGDILLVGDGEIFSDEGLDLFSNGSIFLDLDNDNDEVATLTVYNGMDNAVMALEESGNLRVFGDLTVDGNKSAVAATAHHGSRKLYAVESPEVWFEDFGAARLEDGEATVAFEPVYAETIDPDAGYHVFLTPVCDQPVLLSVTEKRRAGFTARGVGLDGSPSDCSFDYRIAAKRLGFAAVRLEPGGAGAVRK